MDPLVDQALSVADKIGTLGALIIAILAYNMGWIVPGRSYDKLEKRADKQDETIAALNATMRAQSATTDRAMTTVRESRAPVPDGMVLLSPEEARLLRQLAADASERREPR